MKFDFYIIKLYFLQVNSSFKNDELKFTKNKLLYSKQGTIFSENHLIRNIIL